MTTRKSSNETIFIDFRSDKCRSQEQEVYSIVTDRIRIHRIHMFLGLPDPDPDS
jgi:hypothetical protein